MKLLVFAAVLVSSSNVLGAPTASPLVSQPAQKIPQYFLRIDAPKLPWHKRHVVQLSTGLLGLENFTVHPTTPPIPVLPIQVPGQDTYALQIPYGGDDLSKTPYIAALLSNTETAPTALLGIIRVPDPTHKTMQLNPSACPEGIECVADAFAMYALNYESDAGTGVDGGHPRSYAALGHLAYGGFEGNWEAVKDTPGSEGWHICWRPLGDDYHEVPQGAKIEIEIVPMTQH